jgi:hypothetical protein
MLVLQPCGLSMMPVEKIQKKHRIGLDADYLNADSRESGKRVSSNRG